MLKQLFLVSMLCTAPTLHASQDEQDVYQHAQLCLVTAVAAFSLVYVLGKKCFDKPAPREPIAQAAIPTKHIVITISDAEDRPASPIKRKQKKNPSKTTQTADDDFRVATWHETHATISTDFVRDNSLNQGKQVQFASEVRTISPTEEPEQEPVQTRAQILKRNNRALQELLIRKKQKPT